MKSIYFRNFLATAILVFSCFLILGIAFFFLGRGYLINDTQERLNANADEVVRTASALSRQENLESLNLRVTISSLANSTKSHIFITDASGMVVSCSDNTFFCEHLYRQLDESIINALSTDGAIDKFSNLKGFYPDERYVVAKPIYADSMLLGYAFATSAGLSLSGVWSTFIGVALTVAVAVMFIAVLMSLIFSKKISEPLDEMARAARKFAHGDFSVRVADPGNRDDEVSLLQAAFNNMADSLEKSEEHRKAFIANISHELRTPMTTIAGFADGIIDGTIPHEQEEKYLRKIADETRRLSRLTRNMLNIAQTQRNAVDITRRSKFDISELLLKTLLSFEGRATEKNLDVDPQLPQDPMIVFADADSITQVLYNLLDNAVKFAAIGSTITIRLYKRSNKAYISISDRGETIPPDDLPYIFDRFHKSDRSRSLDKDGVGLGLYLVKTIIDSHDEDIAVTSRDGVTTFVFTLPLAM